MSEKRNEYFVFRKEEDNEVYCLRTTPPRFTVKHTPEDSESDVELVDEFYVDLQALTNVPNGLKPDPMVVAEIMREMSEEIAYFLEEEQKGK